VNHARERPKKNMRKKKAAPSTFKKAIMKPRGREEEGSRAEAG